MKKLAQFLVIVGGLNWGLVGFLNVDLIARIFGELSMPARTFYVLIGLAAIYLVVGLFRKKYSISDRVPRLLFEGTFMLIWNSHATLIHLFFQFNKALCSNN